MASVWSKEEYRHQQEEFVSNHGGTTSREVVLAILPNICSILLATTTLGVIGTYLHKNVKAFLEFALTIVPCILCCTIWSEDIISVCISMIIISMINIIFVKGKGSILPNGKSDITVHRRPFLTNFRACTNIITVICILAIDFQIFPRKLAKTEVFGYSLMDTGVGLYILTNALVAPEARGVHHSPSTRSFDNFGKNIKNCTKSCLPLLVLGFGRMLAIELIGYQRHITEYGVHWNFFITLAFVKWLTCLMTTTVNSKYSLLSGIWILAMHEYVLTTKGLKEWVLGNYPREDFISANREGLVSIPGYVGLYLIGVAIGRLIHSTYQNSQMLNSSPSALQNIRLQLFGQEFDVTYNESMILCIKLSLIAAQACGMTLFCDSYFGVSRRLANAGYCTWILTLGTIVLTLLLLVEVITDILIFATTDESSATKTKGKKLRDNYKNVRKNSGKSKERTITRTFEIFEAVNYNGLFFFLFCNLMTGAINMTIRTLYVEKSHALYILVSYMATSLFVVVILYRRQIKIKL